jgi:hypothetical protein
LPEDCEVGLDLEACELDLEDCELDLGDCELDLEDCELDLDLGDCELDLGDCELDLDDCGLRYARYARDSSAPVTVARVTMVWSDSRLKLTLRYDSGLSGM